MQDLKYPINFTFNVTTLAKDFSAVDATGNEVAYVRQKMFKLKEDIQVFNNKSKSKMNRNLVCSIYLCSSACVSICTATACHACATDPVASLDAFSNLTDNFDNPFA